MKCSRAAVSAAGARDARPTECTLGRVAARGLETLVLSERMDGWDDELANNMTRHDLRIHDNSKSVSRAEKCLDGGTLGLALLRLEWRTC